jgi:hypothetical protein
MDSENYMKNDKTMVTLHFIQLVYSRLHSINTRSWGYEKLLKHLYFANTLIEFLLPTCPCAVTKQMTFSSTSQAAMLNEKHFCCKGFKAFKHCLFLKM